jgi:hypothetical protein
VVPLPRLREGLYSLDLSYVVGAPFRPRVVCAPAIGARSFAECGILLALAIPRMMLLSAEDALGFVGTGVSYVSVFLTVVALAYTRSTVIQDRGKDL